MHLNNYWKSLKPKPSEALFRLFLLWFYTFAIGIVIGFAVASLVSSFDLEGEILTSLGVMATICIYSFIYIAPTNSLVCLLLWLLKLTPIVFESTLRFLIEPIVYIFISLIFLFFYLFEFLSPVISLLLPILILGASLITLFKIRKKDRISST